MRVVLDTNVLVSGIFFTGPPDLPPLDQSRLVVFHGSVTAVRESRCDTHGFLWASLVASGDGTRRS